MSAKWNRSTRITLTLTGLLLVSIPPVLAEEAERETPGIAIGERAPSFKLSDQSGKSTGLNDLLKKDRMLAIVFYRSADW